MAIETLQEDSTSLVYRLVGADGGDRNVIAKRGWRSRSERERTVYAEILPELPFSPIEFYGFLPVDGGAAWIFIEEIRGIPYRPDRRDHRALAGRTMGLLHVGGDIGPCSTLDSVGADRFRPDLERIPILLDRAVANESLSISDIEVLDEIRRGCDRIAARWDGIEELDAASPNTLVHNDFKEDHLVVDSSSPRRAVFLLDWGQCGYGSPALDLAKFLGYSVRPQLEAYSRVVRRRWPGMDHDTIRRLAYMGDLLRCLVSIRWAAEELGYESVERPMSTMRVYRQWLHEIVMAAPWDPASPCAPRPADTIPRSWH